MLSPSTALAHTPQRAQTAAANSSDAQGKHCLVLLNPQAAGGKARALHRHLSAHLQDCAGEAALHMSADVTDAQAAVAALPRASRVVLVGGDGSVHPLLPTLLRGGHELALVPAGSGNDTARALGMLALRGMQARLTWALRTPASAIDIGELQYDDGQQLPFISSLAAGFDAAVALRAHAGPRWLAGMPRYLWATLRELAALRINRVLVSRDGELLHDGPTLFASALNTPTYGAGMPVVPGAHIDDGELDLLVAGRFGRLGTLAMLPRLLLGQHLGHAQVHTFRATRLRIEAQAPLPIAADGEPAPAARAFTLQLRPGALRCVRYSVGKKSAVER